MNNEAGGFHKGELLIYQTEDGRTKIDVCFEDDTVWLNQAAMAVLFQTTPQNITQHIKNIYRDCDLVENSTCKNFLQVQNEGGRKIN
ncbi:MAG: hypothetical protein CVV03_12495 [Firmicutes bacterium HGW-Firmicutes-8]|nr:MAG: hypothetical protein CVV03_12495 [Firmicutes bacterium HGW-Firmicutes-8]